MFKIPKMKETQRQHGICKSNKGYADVTFFMFLGPAMLAAKTVFSFVPVGKNFATRSWFCSQSYSVKMKHF